MKTNLTVLFSLVAAVACAAPSVTVKSVSQDAATRMVTVTYALADGPAVVTFSDVRAGGASIGAEHCRTVWGDINRRVVQPDGGDLKFTWAVDRDWPDHDLPVGQLSVALTAWPAGDGPDWMIVNLLVPDDISYCEREGQLPFGAVNQPACAAERLVLKMVRPQGREWLMGSPEGETGRDASTAAICSASGTEDVEMLGKETLHRVRLTKNYYLGVFPLTQGQYENVMASGYGKPETWGEASGSVLNVCRPSWCGPQFNGWVQNYKRRPVEYVSYATLVTPTGATPELSFFANLKAMTGVDFQLPTEAEWEFACRAGTTTGLYSGREVKEPQGYCGNVSVLARFRRNGGCDGNVSYAEYDHTPWWNYTQTTPAVGTYQPNAWGFYDMLGGVWEMCRDRYVRDLGSASATDPLNSSGTVIAVRGGAYNEEAGLCRSASRAGLDQATAYRGVGLRLCLEL